MKCAIVTGTVTGIGKALCEELGKQGYNLTVSSGARVVVAAALPLCTCPLPMVDMPARHNLHWNDVFDHGLAQRAVHVNHSNQPDACMECTAGSIN
jgi:NAD(P)-dependent dehydrogenase (short-subunit alcohol dehydrogenase family)